MYRFLTLVLLLPIFFASPISVLAQDGGYQGIVPDCGADCDACHLIQLGENLLDWLIGILMVIFAIVVAYGGFELVTSGGNVQAKTSAKSKITNALIGIIIVLAAWLLVDTIMKMLLKEGGGQVNGRPWTQIECSVPSDPGGNTP